MNCAESVSRELPAVSDWPARDNCFAAPRLLGRLGVGAQTAATVPYQWEARNRLPATRWLQAKMPF